MLTMATFAVLPVVVMFAVSYPLLALSALVGAAAATLFRQL